MVTPASLKLSTCAIHWIITEGLLLAGVKKPGIVVHSLRHSTPTFALLNDANPTRVQKMMRYRLYATTGDLCGRSRKAAGGRGRRSHADLGLLRHCLSRPRP